ncbi:MAG: hypothetical protein N5P05_000932 [Chroococcopsis gigantea SAG 12.99]|jgi:small-conductance mechanosensitive channel|nr:mechanosensitive ion channel [Chlorogloea purpurea SAG 13.99]MDV2999326.1 hypothetical protein [Chroococcopsis gigantea SAG 12.99]
MTTNPFSPYLFVEITSSTLAQTSTGTNAVTTVSSPISGFLAGLGLGALGSEVLNLISAIIILLVGWIISTVVAGLVKNLLKRTDLDNRLASSVTGTRGGLASNIENLVGSIVFWVLMILTVVAFLNALQLNAVAAPLNNFLNQIFVFLPRLGSALLLSALAWILATIARTLAVRTSQSFGLDDRLSDRSATTTEPNRFLLSETLGNALYWFVFLFFLPIILGVLNLQGPLQPVQNLLNDLLAALPRILKAVLIGLIGWTIARVVREIVSNLLSATGVDRIGNQFGLGQTTGTRNRSLSGIIGTIVYVLILLPTVIAALDALEISAISAPAVSMLNQILGAIPQIFTAALILLLGYAGARFVGDLVADILSGIGFNNIFDWLGFPRTTTTRTTVVSPAEDGPSIVDAPSRFPHRTPAEIIGIVAAVGVGLFATIAATNILNIPALTVIVSGLLVIFGRILAGVVVFGVGLYLANLAFNLITSSGGSQARILGQAARVAVIALVSAMALEQMGIASSIVNLAFGLLLGAVAVAIALAFGLGGRDVAGTQLREWLSSVKGDRK